MTKRFLALGFVATMAVGALALGLDATNIVWKPKAGNTYNYKFKAHVPNVMGQDLDINGQLHHTIKEIRPDGNFVVEDKQDGFSIVLGGNDMSSMAPKSVTENVVYKPNGEVVEKKTDAQESSPRMDPITEFYYPDHAVNVGDKWTRSIKGDKAKSTYDGQLTFTFQGTETVNGVEAYKVGEEYSETGAPQNISASGTVWLSANDGELLKSDMNVKNADFGGQIPQTDAAMSVERVSS